MRHRQTKLAVAKRIPRHSLPFLNKYNGAMDDKSNVPAFRQPSALERAFNSAFGYLVGMGFAPKYMYLLQVRGRKSGKLYATPVNLMESGGKLYLVAPRGRTQWVRNVQATGDLILKRGSVQKSYQVREITGDERLPLLKLYLDSYKGAVQRYFPVRQDRRHRPSPTSPTTIRCSS